MQFCTDTEELSNTSCQVVSTAISCRGTEPPVGRDAECGSGVAVVSRLGAGSAVGVAVDNGVGAGAGIAVGSGVGIAVGGGIGVEVVPGVAVGAGSEVAVASETTVGAGEVFVASPPHAVQNNETNSK